MRLESAKPFGRDAGGLRAGPHPRNRHPEPDLGDRGAAQGVGGGGQEGEERGVGDGWQMK